MSLVEYARPIPRALTPTIVPPFLDDATVATCWHTVTIVGKRSPDRAPIVFVLSQAPSDEFLAWDDDGSPTPLRNGSPWTASRRA